VIFLTLIGLGQPTLALLALVTNCVLIAADRYNLSDLFNLKIRNF
jgi:hypothetical protein